MCVFSKGTCLLYSAVNHQSITKNLSKQAFPSSCSSYSMSQNGRERRAYQEENISALKCTAEGDNAVTDMMLQLGDAMFTNDKYSRNLCPVALDIDFFLVLILSFGLKSFTSPKVVSKPSGAFSFPVDTFQLCSQHTQSMWLFLQCSAEGSW